MLMADTLKLQTNVPVTFEPLLYVNYHEGKPWKDDRTGKIKELPPQLGLKGTVNGVDAYVYVPIGLGKDLRELGVVRGAKASQLEVVGQPSVTVEKFEYGMNKKAHRVSTDGPASPEVERGIKEAAAGEGEYVDAPAPDGAQEALDRMVNAWVAAHRVADELDQRFEITLTPEQITTTFIEIKRHDFGPMMRRVPESGEPV